MRVFISRTLKPDSPLRSWATATGAHLIDRSLITFAPVDFIPPDAAHWWFFYSARAVAFSAAYLPEGVRTAAIGGATARALLERGKRVDFCGNGDPDRTAHDFLAVGEGSRVFFPRARQSRKSIQTALADRLTVLDAICYDNLAHPPAGPIDAEVYVFTSPLNVAAYLDHHPLPPSARVLAMGRSTGWALVQREVACAWPKVPAEAGLVELLTPRLPA